MDREFDIEANNGSREEPLADDMSAVSNARFCFNVSGHTLRLIVIGACLVFWGVIALVILS